MEVSGVFVDLNHSDERIKLTIRDSRKDLLSASAKKGIALMNMQTRAENLNGSFDVETDLGMGCKIWVCCLVKMIRVGR